VVVGREEIGEARDARREVLHGVAAARRRVGRIFGPGPGARRAAAHDLEVVFYLERRHGSHEGFFVVVAALFRRRRALSSSPRSFVVAALFRRRRALSSSPRLAWAPPRLTYFNSPNKRLTA